MCRRVCAQQHSLYEIGIPIAKHQERTIYVVSMCAFHVSMLWVMARSRAGCNDISNALTTRRARPGALAVSHAWWRAALWDCWCVGASAHECLPQFQCGTAHRGQVLLVVNVWGGWRGAET